jgi:hypothetical protein
MHIYRPGNLRDEIPKEGGFGPPWKKKKRINVNMPTSMCRVGKILKEK